MSDRFRPLLDELNERPLTGGLGYPPATYPDGSTDDLTRALDVLADAAAAPGVDPPEAA